MVEAPDPDAFPNFRAWIRAATAPYGVQRRLAEATGVTPQAVTKWRNGGSIQPEQLRRVAEWAQLPYASLRRLVDQQELRADLSGDNFAALPRSSGEVPLISWVQAGHWNDVEDPYSVGGAERWVPCPERHSDRTFALRVRGESMENRDDPRHSYSDGDIIFVDPAREAKHRSCVIVRLEDQKEATFKQLILEGERRYLKALNPHWPQRVIEINGAATILGVVIGKYVPSG